MPDINDALLINNSKKLKKPFHSDEVRSTRQDPSPTEPDLDEAEEASGDFDEDFSTSE